jgi:photosystem II oxygen-evolving enhancer protein 3
MVSRDKVQALLAMLMGFGVGCAVIYVGGGQPAVLSPSVNMAAVSSPMVQQPRMQFLQPSKARPIAQPLRATPERDTEVAIERRGLLNAFAFAAAAGLLNAKEAMADATPVDLKDDRKAKNYGFDIIYEARDLDLPQDVRDGLTQARSSIPETKARVLSAKKKIETEMPTLVKQAYWTQARELLRLQVGTLRFDLSTLASTKAKGDKKAALVANKNFLNEAEILDFAIREKNGEKAAKALGQTIASFDTAIKSYA